jgi:hypothetical protein
MKAPVIFLLSLVFSAAVAQDRAILVPKQVPEAPFVCVDSTDLFGQSYRWFYEGDVAQGANLLRKIVTSSGMPLDPKSYYIVVANFTDSLNPIGMFHGANDFLSTRMFGLEESNLYYIFISRDRNASSFP